MRHFWTLIAAGLTSEDAALGTGVSQPVGTRWFRKAGGMPPSRFRASVKSPSGRHLSFAEREDLRFCMLRVLECERSAAGWGGRDRRYRGVGRNASNRRNAATHSGGLEYRATTAQWHAERAGRRPKSAKLAVHAALRGYVQERLSGVIAAPDGVAVSGPSVPRKGRRHGRRQARRWARTWSPQQMAHRLRIDFPGDEPMRISHEAIYQALFVQGRGALRRELTACLRTGRALRVPRARIRGRGKSFVEPQVMISQRPAEATDRCGARPLEGRPHPGPGQFRDRHPGRADDEVHHAAPPAAHGRSRRRSADQERTSTRRPWC